MGPVPPPDLHHLRAAIGWMELGNPTEAAADLERLSPQFLDHPDVLDAKWGILAAQNRWDAAFQAAEKLVEVSPGRPDGWIHRAYAARRMSGGGLPMAWAALRPAFEKFPNDITIPFNLACYAAQSGDLDKAWEWLHRAMERAGDVAEIKQRALADDDLKPLWERIREL